MSTGEPKGNGGSQPGGLSAEGGNDPEFRQTTSGAHGSAGRADYGAGRDLPSYGAFICFGRRTEGVQGASGKPPACIVMRQICRKKFPAKGNDAPTTAREQGLQPYGAFTLFFRWRKKSVQKKASGTTTPKAAHVAMRRGLRPAVAPSGLLGLGSLRSPAGKSPLLPIFERGSSQCRAQTS